MVIQLSPYAEVILLSWLIAHTIKYSVLTIQGQHVCLRQQLFVSGGMPSSHAAAAVSVLTMVGLLEGTETAIFGLAALVALIICYDAVNVRRASGEQGEAIRQIIKKTKVDVTEPHVSKGHTPLQVVFGALLGAVISVVVFITTIN